MREKFMPQCKKLTQQSCEAGYLWPKLSVKPTREENCMRDGAICGGVMSQSAMSKGMKKHGAYFGMMSFVLPDKQFKRYEKYKHNKNEKMAKKVFDRWAVSQI